MIESVHVQNFRRFHKLIMKGCTRINLIVGESGSGKTALLEAIFLALCNNPQKALVLRQWRGGDLELSGSPDNIIESIYGELFADTVGERAALIRLEADGPEARTLKISRGRGDIRIPKGAKTAAGAEVISPIIFEWTDSKGHKHPTGIRISDKGIEFESTEEILPTWLLFAAQQTVYPRETAARFSILRKEARDKDFIEAFRSIYPWISDVSVETAGGGPVVHGRVQNKLIPLTAISGGVNRIAAILLAIAHRRDGIVLVDEIENGVFYGDQAACADAILRFARKFNCQVFMSTHSVEWLRNFAAAAGKRLDDITLWRLERDVSAPSRFSGKTFKAGVDYGAEVRGEA